MATATKTAKKSSKKASSEKKIDRSMASETPSRERKMALVKLMRKAGATSASTAITVATLARKIGYTPRDVYGLLSGTTGKAASNPACLIATGHAAVADHEDGRAYYLTAKGKSTKFDEAPFALKSEVAKD